MESCNESVFLGLEQRSDAPKVQYKDNCSLYSNDLELGL